MIFFGLDQLNFRPTQGVHSVGASKSLFFALIKEGVVFVCGGGKGGFSLNFTEQVDHILNLKMKLNIILHIFKHRLKIFYS